MPRSLLSPSARPAILAAARRLFAQRGFAGTSMREIALAAGVSKAAIYHHFRDKRHLYRELLDAGIAALTAAMRRIPREGPARVQLARILLLHLEFAREHADLLRMLVREQWRAGERRPVSAAIARHRQEEMALFAAVLQQGIAGGEFKPVDPVLSAQALCVVTDILSAGYVLASPPVTAAEVARNVMDVLLNGLAATPLLPDELAGLFSARATFSAKERLS
ncbi:MAG: TetR/AcrR family transcriptional regulator [Armatimonadota bacterium]|nr:TetR/AcrR family transcriptional regulator [Armatimonadota bacterium]